MVMICVTAASNSAPETSPESPPAAAGSLAKRGDQIREPPIAQLHIVRKVIEGERRSECGVVLHLSVAAEEVQPGVLHPKGEGRHDGDIDA